mmetsp:Transcript_452/g.552  ORF Transcript_452/g.552 Transcript_452/m.552 type:complete len:325 (+) Transcript_452:1325-2299(+)
MKLADTDLNFVLESLTGLGSRMAKSEEDEEALIAAITSVAKTLAEEEDKQPQGNQVSPKAFLSTTYARMKSREKLAEYNSRVLRKELFEKSVDELKKQSELSLSRSKSPNSVHLKLFKDNRDRGFHIEEVRRREVSQRIAKERAACTFTPNSKTKGTRTPEEFVKNVMRWKEKNTQHRVDELAQLAKLEVEECRSKPQLSSRTQRIVKGKLEGSVVKRLFDAPRSSTPPPNYSFHPKLSQNTQRIAETRNSSPLVSRLYPSTFRPERKVDTQRRPKTPTFKGDYDVSMKESYRLNSSRSPMPNLRCEVQSLPMEPSILQAFYNV